MFNEPMRRPKYLGFILLGAIAVTVVGPAVSQTTPKPRPLQMIKPGDACSRKTDKAQGVTKIDACGRWYCGRPDVKDITEARPKFGEEFGCTWRLEGERCKCHRNAVPRKAG